MNKSLELAQDRFIEKIGNMCNKFGLNHFMAQLYAVLYLSNKPLSLDDLTERLKVSKGNVSVNIRELERWGAVRQIWVKGSRKDFYVAEEDIKKIISERVKSSISKRINEVNQMLAEFNDIISSGGKDFTSEEAEIVENYKKRLKKIEELNKMASMAVNFANKIL